jgi:hypothetical protein
VLMDIQGLLDRGDHGNLLQNRAIWRYAHGS